MFGDFCVSSSVECVHTYRLCWILSVTGHLLAITCNLSTLIPWWCKILHTFFASKSFSPQGEEGISWKEIEPRTFSPLSNAWYTILPQYSNTHLLQGKCNCMFGVFPKGSAHFIASHYFFTTLPRNTATQAHQSCKSNMQDQIINTDAGKCCVMARWNLSHVSAS